MATHSTHNRVPEARRITDGNSNTKTVLSSISDGSSADYYKVPTGTTEAQDVISDRNMNAQIGEIFRTCVRYGYASHSDQLRDAKKILFYAQAEVDRLTKVK
jgi:hypothetical protein